MRRSSPPAGRVKQGAGADRHPSVHRRLKGAPPLPIPRSLPHHLIPRDADEALLRFDDRTVKLTNLRKVFWPAERITKGDLLQYYVEVAPALLPHLRDRAMVMKRYPDGITGEFFFMKRAPKPRPDWLETCEIRHSSGSVIDFPIIQDLPSLLWVINLGCIDLNQWYARCADVDRPDCLYFDLDPGPQAPFAMVCESAAIVHQALGSLGMPDHVKTTGSRGIHIAVPIVWGPTQKQVWTFAKALATELAARHRKVITAEYAVRRRPPDRVLVDYNQNAWGRTLASIYSVRPRPRATVSTPVTWRELGRGIALTDFRLDNVPARVRRRGDLWKRILAPRGRFELRRFV